MGVARGSFEAQVSLGERDARQRIGLTALEKRAASILKMGEGI